MTIALCPRCTLRMMVIRSVPHTSEYETVVLRCARCAVVKSVTEAIDPMKSPLAGWCNADLCGPS